MLPKQDRLNLSKDFKWVVKGKKVNTPNLKLFFVFSDNQSPKIGIAISKKDFKKANKRNRARRLISKAVETHFPALKRSLNLVIMPKASVVEKKPQQLEQELQDVKDLFTNN